MDWSLDGKEYKYSDKAPIGCNDCRDCDSCCHMMGDTIIQDPYDLWLFGSNMRVAGGAPVSFEILISEDGPWELSVQDGIILPNIKMVEEGRCPFLNEEGRCSIHPIRSGFCRLFPLGRGYKEEGTVVYYVLNETLGCEKLKGAGYDVRISKWLGYPSMDIYEKFSYMWHEVKEELKCKLANDANYVNQDTTKSNYVNRNTAVLQANFLDVFYTKAYKATDESSFLKEFEQRCQEWRQTL